MNTSTIKKRYEWQAFKKLNEEESNKTEHVLLKLFNLKYDVGKGLQMKSQDELIGDGGTYKKRFGINRFKLPQQMAKNKVVDARTDQISTIPRTLEEHEELDALNSSFKGRLEDIASGSSLPSAKGKKKVEDIDENEERINKNKKRIVSKQGERENSNSE
ncbi:unnamed protein product [Rhizophagus irregularis]|uniref:Uncharacterized protein n=1 Tax=Rhizophagus irregularis TaxID=588596 RepID=A0A2I1H3X3_9GLOM|nr:hypothetical protein RhiirA4_471861 [Rhizophagus irregularis]CAB4442377.1 unnamed protein product [Rhizophagus irregularis]